MLGVYFLFDPLSTVWMPKCVFHEVTGFQCMGCGSQRMLHALLHGDLAGAMRANMFLFFSLPVILFLLFTELWRKRFPGLYRKIYSVPMIITTAAMLGAWLLVRNMLGI